MMRSLFSAVSGLKNHQIRMDVVGNNIANVNTVAYKSSRTGFREVFSQTLRGASAPQSGTGGTNPQQVGLGMSVSAIEVLHNQGNLEFTGKSTDMAIEGSGFFIVKDGASVFYTRAGNFDRDASGYLVDAAGRHVQGWMDNQGSIDASGAISSIIIPMGQSIGALATQNVLWRQNLDSSQVVGIDSKRTTSVDVFDSQGNSHLIIFTFEKTGENEWAWQAQADFPITDDSGSLHFNTGGIVVDPGVDPDSSLTPTITFQPPGADQMQVTLDFTEVTQYSGESTIKAVDRDGNPMGALESFTIDSSGVITGAYSNGMSKLLAQVALAGFSNPAGLEKSGDNLYQKSNNSGQPMVGQPGTGGLGKINPSNLEMSNVDLAVEFTNMIVTQRGFQANSRVITATDEMLQELVSLKR